MQAIIEPSTGPPPPAPPAWAGWVRPHRGAAFVKVAEAADYDKCWELLLDRLHERGQRGGDSLVAPFDVNPNQGASARRPTTASR